MKFLTPIFIFSTFYLPAQDTEMSWLNEIWNYKKQYKTDQYVSDFYEELNRDYLKEYFTYGDPNRDSIKKLNLKSVSVVHYPATENGLYQKELTLFDREGNIHMIYNTGDSYTYSTLRQYDGNNKLISSIDTQYSHPEIDTFYYHPSGKLICHKNFTRAYGYGPVYIKDSVVFSYNEKGLLFSEKGRDYFYTYKHDSLGNIVEIIVKGKKIHPTHSSGSLPPPLIIANYSMSCFYNKNNNIVCIEHYDLGGNFNKKEEFIYDDEGYLISEKWYDNNNKLLSGEETVYENHKIKSSKIYVNGNCQGLENWHYNKEGKLISRAELVYKNCVEDEDDEQWIYVFYDEQGKLKKVEVISCQNGFTEYPNTMHYKYNKNGKFSKVISDFGRDEEGHEMNNEYIFKYTREGLIKKEIYKTNRKIKNKTDYEYKFY